MHRVRRGLVALAVAATSLTVGATIATVTPAGASPFTVTQGTDLPIADSGTQTSMLNIPADTCQSPLNDVNLAVTWNHTNDFDLVFRLRAPSGTIITLMDDEGGAQDNGQVLFDDESNAAIENVNNVSPAGWFRPEQALSIFNGEPVTGNWSLVVIDDQGGDSGAITSWSLKFNCFDQSADLPISSTALSPILDQASGTSTVNVPVCDVVTDVNVEAVFQHQLASDLVFEVTHGGVTVVLWDSNADVRRGGWLVFDDEDPTPLSTLDAVTNTNPGEAWPLLGIFRPDDPLSAFDGMSGAGAWDLEVRDVAAGDEGELQQFGVAPTCAAAPPPPPPPPGSAACEDAPEDGFVDVPNSNVHESNIDCIFFYGIAQGTTPTTYTPAKNVTRAQIATFVARVLQVAGVALPPNPPDAFPGDNAGAPHELSVNQLASIGVIGGNGETGNRYNPSVSMRRDDMASFLAGAYEAIIGNPLPAGDDAFTDDTGNPHEAEINALAAREVVLGTGGTSYNPSGTVTRASMGSFLARTLQELVDDGGALTPI